MVVMIFGFGIYVPIRERDEHHGRQIRRKEVNE